MKMPSYIKSEAYKVEKKNFDCEKLKEYIVSNAKKVKLVMISVMTLLLISQTVLLAHKQVSKISCSEVKQIQMVPMPIAATASKKTTLIIPSGTVKANPFLPYRDIDNSKGMSDVPNYTLAEPPTASGASSDAVRVMDTIVSGILYDNFSPSAILNIEGSDYLVKKGDVVNNYKVLAIAQDSVTVQLGANIYKAGIGEILTEGSMNHNNVSNLENKFGGVR